MASGEEGALVLVPDVHWIESIPYPGVLPAHVIHKIPDLQVYQDDVYVTGYSKSGRRHSFYHFSCKPLEP